MADTIVKLGNRRVLGKILQRLARGSSIGTDADRKSNLNVSRLRRQCWYIADADPVVSAASSAEAPVQLGDLAYRVDNDKAFICSQAPKPTTASLFIQLHV